LLNQYFKRCSNKPWGYRCYNSFSKGLYPIVPLDLLNHPSQKHRHINIHHFASHILALITSLNVIKEENMKSLWSLVERLSTYEKMTKNISPIPITFNQLMGLTNYEDGQYFRLLLTIAARMEKHVPCYTLGVYTLSEALQIMKSGLKEEIRKQQLLIVNKRKAELN
jgi:hypothetical protein